MAEESHKAGALSPEMPLLGLLFAGPCHGYDLHKKVNSELDFVWHLSQSQAYSILKRLEKRGEVSIQEIAQERLPSRQLLRLTPLGKKRFLSWLEAPSSGSIRAIRLEFITRIYFARIYFPEKLPRIISIQREGLEFHIARLKKVNDRQTPDRLYNRMSLSLRLVHLENVRQWLDEFEQEILKPI